MRTAVLTRHGLVDIVGLVKDSCRIHQLRQPAYLDGLPLDVSASVGLALHPAHGNDFGTLMRHADVATYKAKRRGDTVAIYETEADHSSPERLSLLADLRRALVHPDHAGEITFHYQPQVAITTGRTVGVEALVRWRHPERGMIAPDELLRAAEHSSVMRLLTLRAIDDVLAQLERWHNQGISLEASINVSRAGPAHHRDSRPHRRATSPDRR